MMKEVPAGGVGMKWDGRWIKSNAEGTEREYMEMEKSLKEVSDERTSNCMVK